jgi:uncharacterized protein YjbI with pentapeptide repeats
MANREQLEILKQGVAIWNNWADANPSLDIDLSNADLSNMDLRGAQLTDANLAGANLSGSRLDDAQFINANLEEVNLSNTSFVANSLLGTWLKQANFHGAELLGVHFDNANLKGANLKNVDLAFVVFDQTDLSGTFGLEEVRHSAPSTVGTNTLQLSKGRLPEKFLRGCGLSDWEIESAKLYNPELNNEEINQILYRIYEIRARQSLQISPLFISYNHVDSVFVDKLEVLLNSKGIRYWRDIHSATSGRLEKQIDRAIRQNPTVLLVLSENSIKSDWVQHEVRVARELEKTSEKDVLCPVALDESWKSSAWPQRFMEQVMEYNILDFSKWENDQEFKKMFAKLSDGLNLYYKK